MATRDATRLGKYRIGFVEYYLKTIAKKNHRILDVGCGMGQYRNSTLSSYVGLDITDQTYGEECPRDVDIVASGQDIPSPNCTYDLVFTVGVLLCIPNPKKALSEFYRVLRSGGRILIFDYNRRVQRRLQFRGGHGKLPCWTQWELKTIVRQAGFKECELLLPKARSILDLPKWLLLAKQEVVGGWAIVTGVK
jgi:ubiquinone/menaquinone biosynthesis C-methylase UbiE